MDEVIRLFSSRDLLFKWQKGLISSEPVSTPEGKQQYLLSFKLGRRKMKMTETILKNKLPEQYDVHYALKGAQHTSQNKFFSTNANQTKWISEVEYSFTGLMNILARFMKEEFEKQSWWYMQSFKAFAEKSERS